MSNIVQHHNFVILVLNNLAFSHESTTCTVICKSQHSKYSSVHSRIQK